MRGFKLIVLAGAVAAGGAGFWGWWRHEAAHPSTDDATLQADILSVSPLVGGRVTEVDVAANAHVHKGDVLFRLDPAPFEAARDAAVAQLAQAQQGAASSQDQTGGATANLQGAAAALSQAQTEFDRQNALYQDGDVAKAALDAAQAALDHAKSAEGAAQAALASAQSAAGQAGPDNAAVRAAAASLAVAELNLSDATVSAPADGWVSSLSLRPGQVVAPDQALFSIVEDGAWWVDADFKETDLARIRPGLHASVTLDMYPGLALAGAVDSVGAGSGAEFSLLPPENATGNWVKVTQRFPVRIRLDERPADPGMPLRAGASATVTVDASGVAS